MGVEGLLAHLREEAGLGDRLRLVHTEPARPSVAAPLPESLPEPVQSALRARGIESLYSHQLAALELARRRRDLVVSTGTASGKSLCFLLPILEQHVRAPGSTALLLYPTKALSRDQLAGLRAWIERAGLDLRAEVYDGDTPPSARRALRAAGDVVLSNPYMLHAGILPHHGKWAHLFQGLRFVVLDEVHLLRGVHGSHVANLLRRLQRLARHHGSDPTFLMASATLGNPRELAETLVGRPVEWIHEDGSARGARHHATLQPEIVHRELGLRRSVVDEAVRLARPLLRAGTPTIFFARSRSTVEVLLKYLKDLAARLGVPERQVRGYRGGYLPELRREIEAGLRAGEIRCVVATNALELGIDVGALDVVVLVGYPGSVAATLQRAGRAGRREQSSLCILIARSVATDQYVAQHPGYLFDGPAEQAFLDPDNVVIRASHLKCAAFELPFSAGEEFGGGGGDTGELLRFLEREARILVQVDGRYHYAASSFPADGVSLDTGDVDSFVILDADRRTPIAEIDRPSAISMVHPGAIYQLQGVQYHVESMDYPGRRVVARQVDVDYYTEAEVEAEVRVLHLDHAREFLGSRLWWGDVSVRKIVPMYKKVRFYTHENIGAGSIALPPEDLDTEGLAWVFPVALLARRGAEDCQGLVLQGLAELLRNVLPLRVRCDPADVGATAEVRSHHFAAPTLYVWDEVPGGVGLMEQAFAEFPALLQAMAEVVAGCSCAAGCPACVGASLAGGSKRATRQLLAELAAAASSRPALTLLTTPSAEGEAR